MKNESRAAISGLKGAGVIALLASLLFLLPMASAGSYSMTAEVAVELPGGSFPAIGEEINFVYTLTNIGDRDLYNVDIEGILEGNYIEIDQEDAAVLGPGESIEASETYFVAEGDVQTHWSGTKYVLEDAMATAENIRNRVIVVSYASASVIVDA